MALNDTEFAYELSDLPSEDEFKPNNWIYFSAENKMEADEIWSIVKPILKQHNIDIVNFSTGKLLGDIVYKFKIEGLTRSAAREIEGLNQKLDTPRLMIL